MSHYRVHVTSLFDHNNTWSCMDRCIMVWEMKIMEECVKGELRLKKNENWKYLADVRSHPPVLDAYYMYCTISSVTMLVLDSPTEEKD